MYTPVNPSFTMEKWGIRGSILYRYVYVIFLSAIQFFIFDLDPFFGTVAQIRFEDDD